MSAAPVRAALLVPVLAVAACGDNRSEGVCAVPDGALLTDGELTHPDDLALPATCVPGGLRDLPGRWFLRDPSQSFYFYYPKFEGSCEAGFRDFAAPEDDLDLAGDGRTFQIWTDGTVYFQRTHVRTELAGGDVYEWVRATALCMLDDGRLAVAFGAYDGDAVEGVTHHTGTGTRFTVKDEPARGLERVGSLGKSSDTRAIVGFNVVVDGDLAYVVGPEGLDMIDVADPAQPRLLGHIGGLSDRLPSLNDVRVVRGNGRTVAFASPRSSSNETNVIDVTDPTRPMYLANLPEYSHSVQVRTDGQRQLLYLATYTNSVPVYDVTDPTQPMRLGAPTIAGEEGGIHDLTVDGDRLYLNKTTEGTVAVDVSAGLDQPVVERWRTPTTYSHASAVATIGGRRVVLHGDEGMTPEGGAFLRINDDDPASPTYGQVIGRYQSRPEVGIHNIEVVGDRAYIAYYHDGVRVLDLSDPTQPRELAHHNTWDESTAPGGAFEGALGVRVANGLIYVADDLEGLVILREVP